MDKIAELLKGVRKRDLLRWLQTDKRVREWIAGGALVSTKQAAEVLGVERSRIWRWEKAGKLHKAYDAGATPLYWRHELEALLADDATAPQRRSRAAA